MGDRSRAASGPNVGQPQVAMDEQFMAQMGEFMRRLVGVVPPPVQQVAPPPVQRSPIEGQENMGQKISKAR